jgi:hypothetical protein
VYPLSNLPLIYSSHCPHYQATHAAGKMEAGTPHTIHYGQGDKAQTIKPSTVGQAQKDVSANLPRAESPPPPGMLQQAQTAASSAVGAAGVAVSSITGAIGGVSLGGSKAEEKSKPEEKAEDPRVHEAKDEQVEDFLKAQYPSSTGK